MNEKKKHLVVSPEIHKKIKRKATDDGIPIEKATDIILKKWVKKELKSEKNEKK